MTHCEKVLDLLADGEWHDHMEGYRLGVMLHSRVADLRKKGHLIECDKTGGQYRYRLLSETLATNPQAAGGSSVSLRQASKSAAPLVGARGAAEQLAFGVSA